MRFKGMTAIATGAASGMGLLFSQCFAAEGGNVLLCDINEAALKEKTEAITGTPRKPVLGDRVVAEVIGREGDLLDRIYNVPQAGA